MIDTVRKMIREAISRIRLGIRGEINQVDDDYLVNVEMLDGEVDAGVEMFQQYGFRSRPPAGVEFLAVPLGRKGTDPVIVATRQVSTDLSLAEGEVGIGFSNGGSVIIKANGDIEIKATSGQEVTINDGAGGSALVKKSEFDGHVHSIPEILDSTPAVCAFGPGPNIGNTNGAGAVTGTTVLKGK